MAAKQTNGQYYAKNDWPNVYSFRSNHSKGLQFAMADGPVTFAGETIDTNVYRGLATAKAERPLAHLEPQ